MKCEDSESLGAAKAESISSICIHHLSFIIPCMDAGRFLDRFTSCVQLWEGGHLDIYVKSGSGIKKNCNRR